MCYSHQLIRCFFRNWFVFFHFRWSLIWVIFFTLDVIVCYIHCKMGETKFRLWNHVFTVKYSLHIYLKLSIAVFQWIYRFWILWYVLNTNEWNTHEKCCWFSNLIFRANWLYVETIKFAIHSQITIKIQSTNVDRCLFQF